MKNCAICQSRLGKANKSGYCRAHANKMLASPERSAKISASLTRFYADPMARARAAETCRKNCMTESARLIRQRKAREIGLSAIGRAVIALDPAIVEKRAAKQSASLLAHIPRELRGEYKRLRHSKKLSAAEASEIILAQHEADMARFRREIGAVG